MLIDINFLEHKTKQSSKVVPVSILFACMIVVLVSIYIYQGKQVSQLKTLQQRLSEKKQLEATRSGSIQSKQEVAVQDLDNASSLLEAEPLQQTSSLLTQLSNLLPESGVINTFNWSDSTKYTANISFVSSRQAAYFLADLEKQPYVTDVTLDVISAENVDNSTQFDVLPKYLATYTMNVDMSALENAAKKEKQ